MALSFARRMQRLWAGPRAPQLEPRPRPDRYEAWVEVNGWSERRAGLLAAALDGIAERPRIAVEIVPRPGGDESRTAESLAAQIYDAWEPRSAGSRAHYVAFVAAGDVLVPDALAEIALHAAGGADLLYTDDDEIDGSGRRLRPRFKPDWSPELLLSTPYIDGLVAVRSELLEGIDADDRHELLLRVAERAQRVVHIPKVLCHRVAAGEPVSARPIRFPDDGPHVAVLVPTRNRVELLSRCLESLRGTTYRDYEVVVVDNESDDPQTIDYLARCPERVLNVDTGGTFDFARLVNRAVEAVDADAVLLLNNDTEVVRSDWLSQMVGYLGIDGVGAVGARLLFPDGTMQHAGDLHGLAHGLAGHVFSGLAADDPGYLSYAHLPRNCGAVTAACLLVRRELFLELGGFDAERFAVSYNDVDLCHRIVDAGYRIVYCPDAELIHREGSSRSRNTDPAAPAAYRALYATRRDRYYNPNLSLEHGCYPLGTRTLPPRLTRAIPTVVEGAPAEEQDLVRRLLEGDVIVSASWDAAEVALAWGLDGRRTIDAATRRGLPSLWILDDQRDWRSALDSLPRREAVQALDALAAAYQVVVDADPVRSSWLEAARENVFTVPRAIDVERFRSGLPSRDDARARLRLAPHETAAVVDRMDEVVAAALERTGIVQVDSYAAADLVVCGRVTPSYSTTMLEAMAAGLPFVAPPFAEVGHEVSEGVCSRAYAPGSPDGLAAALRTLVDDEQERARLGANGPRVLAALPDFASRARDVASLIAEAWLVGRPRPLR